LKKIRQGFHHRRGIVDDGDPELGPAGMAGRWIEWVHPPTMRFLRGIAESGDPVF
jgi:hypothetical protein